jgi:hypothetical protein
LTPPISRSHRSSASTGIEVVSSSNY